MSIRNHFYYQNPVIDKLIEQGRVEIEIDEAVYVPIRNYEHLAVYNPNVKNFALDASNYLLLREVTIK